MRVLGLEGLLERFSFHMFQGLCQRKKEASKLDYRTTQIEAAHPFKLPRRTLRNNLSPGAPGKILGRSNLLNFELEKQFCE